VVVVDLDPQGSLTRALLSEHGRVAADGRLKAVIDEGRTLAEALRRRSSDQTIPIDTYLKPGIGPNGTTYSLLANEAKCWDVERQGLKKPGENKLKAIIRKIVRDLAAQYEYVLIDCPPGQTVLAEAAVETSDLVLCPITPDWLSYWGLESFDGYLRELFEGRQTEKRPVARFVFTKFKSRPPGYDPQDVIHKHVQAFREPDRYVTLLREPGEQANTSQGSIVLPHDPKVTLRLEGWPHIGRVWPWRRAYTLATQEGLLRLVTAMKKELERG
jgi:cellulose biosynthesis protein BcsQ